MKSQLVELMCPVCERSIVVRYDPVDDALEFGGPLVPCPCGYSAEQYDELVRQARAAACSA